MVKVVDGDATLYTYKFLFNAKTNVGEFADGGRGDSTAKTNSNRTVVTTMPTTARADLPWIGWRSAARNTTSRAIRWSTTWLPINAYYFFDRTNIWNTEGDYLYADRGSYDKGGDTLYTVTRKRLYPDREAGDVERFSIDYYKRAEDHVDPAACNIQIDDTEHKVLAFGDYGEYWKEPGNAFLTRRPAVVSYDTFAGRFALHARPTRCSSLRSIRTTQLRRSLRAEPVRPKPIARRRVCVPIHCRARFAGATPAGELRRRPSCGRIRSEVLAARPGIVVRGAGRRETERNRSAPIRWRRDGRIRRFAAGRSPAGGFAGTFRPSLRSAIRWSAGYAGNAYLKEQAAKVARRRPKKAELKAADANGRKNWRRSRHDARIRRRPNCWRRRSGRSGVSLRAMPEGRVETPRPSGARRRAKAR